MSSSALAVPPVGKLDENMLGDNGATGSPRALRRSMEDSAKQRRVLQEQPSLQQALVATAIHRVGAARRAPGRGRSTPSWAGCRRLRLGDNACPDSGQAGLPEVLWGASVPGHLTWARYLCIRQRQGRQGDCAPAAAA